MDGDGRTLGDGATEGAAGVVGAMVGDARAGAAGVVATGGVATGDTATDGLGRGLMLADGRTLGVGDIAGLGLLAACTVGDTAGAALGVGLALAIDGEGLVAAGVGLVVAGVGLAAVGAAEVVGAAGVADAVVRSTGLTNFFGGAFGGGVDSVLILVRARSAAERSLISVQPLSTFMSTTRSFTRRGLTTLRTSVRRGTETSSSSPLTLACVSMFRCRRNR